ncbi:hypothetical protein [Gynuella sp.]|uniref:hypothetical protein n=1 Tax=Gynuella sp. TaxID=2969146 RepID=UPI003D101DAC
MRPVFFVFCFTLLTFYGQAENCLPTAKDYWAPKITQYSTLLGHRLTQKKTDASVINSAEYTDWKTAVMESARQLDITFPSNYNNSFVALSSALLAEFPNDEASQQNLTTLPDIKFSIADDFDAPDQLILIGKTSKRIKINSSQFDTLCNSLLQCNAEGQSSCQLYLDTWAKAVSAYKQEKERVTPQKMAELALEYNEDWAQFFNEARSQTMLDRMLTAQMNRKMLVSQTFQKAPDTQYFLAHPGVVMEYADQAADGEQLKAALSVEWLGVNRWRGCNFGFTNIPCGLSIISVYSDKASSRDVGHGAMFHFNNAYSLGLIDRSGQVSVFITVDILKAFEAETNKIQKWQKQADKFMKPFS